MLGIVSDLIVPFDLRNSQYLQYHKMSAQMRFDSTQSSTLLRLIDPELVQNNLATHQCTIANQSHY